MWAYKKLGLSCFLMLTLVQVGCGRDLPDNGDEEKVSLAEDDQNESTKLGEAIPQGKIDTPNSRIEGAQIRLLEYDSANGGEVITIDSGQLIIRVNNRPLQGVLNEISRQSKVMVMGTAGTVGQTLSVQLDRMPLDQGLRHILKDYDIFFFYSAQDSTEGKGAQASATAPLKAVWIYPKGEGLDTASTLPRQETGTADEIKKRMANLSVAERARWVELLIEQKKGDELEAVEIALNDPNDEVRERTLHAALNSGVTLPSAWIENLAVNDFSPMVRFLAMGAFIRYSDDSQVPPPNARTIAQMALRDPSLNVRERAHQILEQMAQPAQSFQPEEEKVLSER